jgi:threonine/homoserine/homoserine lactone efflux protein
MLISIISGLIAGFVLAMPPGPVGVTVMKLSLDKGARHGIFASLGTAAMDFIFALITVFATSALILIVDNFAADFPLGVLILQFSVIIGILAYGFYTIRRTKRNQPADELLEDLPPKNRIQKFIDYLKHRGPFLLGLAVTLANAANPTFLGSIAYVSMQLQKWGWVDSSFFGRMFYAISFGIGTFFWFYILVKLLIYYKPRMSGDLIMKIKKFAGLTLIGFGTLLGYRVIELTKWSEILRLLFAL